MSVTAPSTAPAGNNGGRRAGRRPIAAVAAVAFSALVGFATATAAEVREEFDALPAAKALAVAPERPETVRAVVHSQPHDLAASLAALERCQALASPGDVCEVVRLNDERITTGREILDRVPKRPHPLFLWHYRHGPVQLYLAGSIHLLKPTLYPLPAQLTQAFEGSDYLVLEVDVEAVPPATLQQRTLEHGLLPQGESLETVLPPPLYRRLERQLGAYGMSARMVGAAKPAMVMNQLVVARLMALGYLANAGLENHFLERRTRQRVLELESLESQLALLFDQPMPVQIALLDEALELADQIEPLLAGMVVAWLAGDDAAFLELFRAQAGDSPHSRAFNEALLDDRNRHMADRIADLLAQETEMPASYFVLVGAAHLVGDEGIVALLERRGIHGRRIRSDERLP